MLFKSKKVLGLDIGTTSLKMVELDVSRSGAVLNAFGFTPTPANCISGGEIQNVAVLAEAVNQLIKEVGSRRKNIATGLWGTSVIVKKISMPKMDDKLLSEQIKWEAEQYIPFDVSETSLEFQRLKNSSTGENMEVLLVAAKSELVLRYIEAVQTAGVNCSVLDVSGFALANCYDFNYGQSQAQIALLNVGASVTNFVVVDNGNPVFTRDIPVGGMSYNRDLQNEMGVSAEEAESLKISASLAQPVPDDVHRIMTSTTETLSQEVHNSFDFFSATAPSSSISKFYISGGCSGVPNLTAQISKSVNVPGEFLDPFRRITVNSKRITSDYLHQIRPFAAVALGLGLREEGDK